MELIKKMMYTGLCMAAGAVMYHSATAAESTEVPLSMQENKYQVFDDMALFFSEITGQAITVGESSYFGYLAPNDSCNARETFQSCNELLNTYLTCSEEDN